MHPHIKINEPQLVTIPVGGLDTQVIALNRKAQRELTDAENRLEIIPEASHLFEEPGKLDQVTMLACQWFKKYLS